MLLAALCAAAPGCDDPAADTTRASADFAAVEGLSLRGDDLRVEGRFTLGDAEIEFVLARDGDARSIVVSDREGAPLLESFADAGHETVTLFGGRAVLSGDDVMAAPEVEGDANAFAELKAMPEARGIAQLHAALEQAGVDPVLLGREPADDELTPRLYNDGTYWNLDGGETVQLGTWGWLSYTTIALTHSYGGACVQYQAGFGGWSNLCSYNGQEGRVSHQFWGAVLQIYNPYWSGVIMKVRTY